jgi:fumarylpyruvate hydrolase
MHLQDHLMSYVITPPAQVSLPVKGTEARFPVRRVYCVGRNYADHAIEMGHDPSREPPFFFQKNADNILEEGKPFPYPSQTSNVHFEVECVVALKCGGADIKPEDALSHVYGYGVGIDMTRRDIQDGLKKMGRSWEGAKAFEHSAPMSALVPVSEIGHPSEGLIWLDVNGVRRQTGDLNQMIWKTSEVIAELSKFFTLAAGDVIMTGTPSGVGPIVKGDEITCGVDGLANLSVTVI